MAREKIAMLARQERQKYRDKHEQLLQALQLPRDTDVQTGLLAALDKLKALQVQSLSHQFYLQPSTSCATDDTKHQ